LNISNILSVSELLLSANRNHKSDDVQSTSYKSTGVYKRSLKETGIILRLPVRKNGIRKDGENALGRKRRRINLNFGAEVD
jgi:hypothetical protein